MHHIGLGKAHAGQPVRMLIHDLHVTVINRDTGEILRELVIDPDKNYQPRGLPPGPNKGTPRKGGMKKGYRYPKKYECPGTSDKGVPGLHNVAGAGFEPATSGL